MTATAVLPRLLAAAALAAPGPLRLLDGGRHDTDAGVYIARWEVADEDDRTRSGTHTIETRWTEWEGGPAHVRLYDDEGHMVRDCTVTDLNAEHQEDQGHGDALDVDPAPDPARGDVVARVAEALEAHDLMAATHGAGLTRAPLWSRLARIGIATALASRWAGVLDDAERPADVAAERHARTKLTAEVAAALAEAARDNADETDGDWTELAREIVREIEPEDRGADAPDVDPGGASNEPTRRQKRGTDA